jgi:hypothetical protein
LPKGAVARPVGYRAAGVEAQAQVTAPELRPLGVGEILDVAIKIYWRNALAFVRIVLLVVAPVEILSSLVAASAGASQDDFLVGSGNAGTIGSESVWVAVTGSLVVLLLGFLASTLATGACFKAVADAYLGEQPDWRTSLGYAFHRLRSIVWVTLLASIAAGLGLILCIIPGVFLWVAFAVAVPALLTEGVKGSGALGRSRSLVQGRWWPTFGLLLIGSLLAGVAGAATGGLASVFAATRPGSVAAVIVSAIAGTVGSVITTPFTAAFTTVLYFDLRVRKEGFDLHLLAERIGLAPPAEGDFRPAPPLAPRTVPGAGGQQPPYWPPPPGWRPTEEPAGDAPPAQSGEAARPPYWPPPPGWNQPSS